MYQLYDRAVEGVFLHSLRLDVRRTALKIYSDYEQVVSWPSLYWILRQVFCIRLVLVERAFVLPGNIKYTPNFPLQPIHNVLAFKSKISKKIIRVP